MQGGRYCIIPVGTVGIYCSGTSTNTKTQLFRTNLNTNRTSRVQTVSTNFERISRYQKKKKKPFFLVL